MSELKKIITVLMVVILSSCMKHDHVASIKLSPNFVNSDIGNGKSIYLNVIDNEPSRMIGKKSNYVVRSKGGGVIDFSPADPGDIYSDLKIEYEINKTLKELFSNKGFDVNSAGISDSRRVNFTLLDITYNNKLEFPAWKYTVSVSAQLFVSGTAFVKSYNVENNKVRMMVPGAGGINAHISEAIEELIEKVANDEELFQLLNNDISEPKKKTP